MKTQFYDNHYSENLAPIVLFVYKRPQHAARTLEALSKNRLAEDSLLFIFSDGPKEDANEFEIAEINQVRQVIRQNFNFKKIEIIERKENLGLANSIITGVTDIINRYGKVIVIEADIETSPGFLDYMNTALKKYEHEQNVMHIAGFIPPVDKKMPETFFYRSTTCWGWATWQRAWNYFENDTVKLLRSLKKQNLLHAFNFDGTEPDMEKQLIKNIEGKIETWAIKWYASVFLRGGLCLHPGRSLVNNIGLDNTGTHPNETNDLSWERLAKSVVVQEIPIIESQKASKAIATFYKYFYYSSNIKTRIIRRFRKYKRFFRKVLHLNF